MKIIYIARHAKSSWDDFTLSDHDRPLLPIGKKRTGKVASWLKQQQIFPDKIMSSTATRAYQTAMLLANSMVFPLINIEKERSLYGADTEDIIEICSLLSDKVNRVMLVGHNPGFTDFVNLFLDQQEPIANLPTSAVAAIGFETESWKEIDSCPHDVLFIITPKMLK